MQMRLLNVRTLEFCEYPCDVPKYVVASHRWKAGTEATIKDIKNKRNTDKKGYQKVEGFAKYVRENIRHVEWLWIDTCCVNQDSSQEVTEAVNSMFRWYADAEVCLAYLVDVSDAENDHDFRRSDWFCRGWTLQELLVPQLVVFLSEDWKVIGHKGGDGWTKSGIQVSRGRALEAAISTITSVPECVLYNYNRSKSFSVEERLAWIRSRKTTKEEDMSYSLLGIFNAAMPVIYGEGAEKAKRRLIEEISKASISTHGQSTNQSMPTAVSPLDPVPCAIIPFRRDPDYVPREFLIDQVRQKLSGSEARVALVGLGGVGKSLLAIEYAHQVRERKPETWVLWLHASNAVRFEQSVQYVVDQLKIPGRDDPKANVFKLFEAWLRDQRKGRWLLILDNADDARFLREPPSTGNGATSDGHACTHQRACLDYLPVCDHGSILFTSRSRHAATQLVDDGDVVAVPPMNEEHARTLLEKKLGRQHDGGDISELARELEFMPLAITQAASYIQQRGALCSVRQYLERLRKNDKSKMSLLDQDKGNHRRDKEASNCIVLTWQISFEHIRQVRPSAADLLSLMSFFDRQAIPESLLKERSAAQYADITRETARSPVNDDHGSDSNSFGEDGDSSSEISFDDNFGNDVTMLLGYSFIAVTTDVASFEMHRLVQLATQRWLEAEGQLERWQQQFVMSLEAAFPTGDYEDWAICQTLFPHAKSALRLRFRESGAPLRWAAVMYRAAWYALSRGSARDAEEMARCSRKVRARDLGQHHTDTLASTAMVALSRKDQGRWGEAEELEVQVMETTKRLLGEEHPDTLTSIANLASTYWNQGRWGEAEELDVQIMEMRKRVLGEEHPSTLKSMGNLASTYRNQGRWGEAEELFMQVMETTKRLLGEEHPDTLTSMGNLALTYMHQGRWGEAEELFVQVMETTKRLLGEEHPSTLTSMGNLASTYWNQGRWGEAEELDVQVIETRKRVLGEEHPDTLTSMGNLALTYMHQGRWDKAKELFVQVIETTKRVLGNEHPDTLTSMANLASTYRNQGRWGKAEELFVQVIETTKRVLGEEHPSTLTSMGNLALTYLHQGQWDKAEELFVQVMETRKRVLGNEHPDTLTSMANLAHTQRALGNDRSAFELMRSCAALSSQILGPNHPHTNDRHLYEQEWNDDHP